MTYKELYTELEKEIIDPIKEKYGLMKYKSTRIIQMAMVREIFPSLKYYENDNGILLGWEDEVKDNLELACKNDLIMYVSRLQETYEQILKVSKPSLSYQSYLKISMIDDLVKSCYQKMDKRRK